MVQPAIGAGGKDTVNSAVKISAGCSISLRVIRCPTWLVTATRVWHQAMDSLLRRFEFNPLALNPSRRLYLPTMTPVPEKKTIKPKRRTIQQIGWRECVGLPDLGIPAIKAKIDTGARTSALCAEDIRVIEGKVPQVSFTVPYAFCGQKRVTCVAPLLGKRDIRNTSGLQEERFVIKTLLVIDGRRWHIEVSLANRENMGFDFILGRTALRGHGFSVNPSRSYLAGDPVRKKPTKTKASQRTPS